jgi:SapC
MSKFAPVSRELYVGKKWQRPKTYSFSSTNALVPIVGAELARAMLGMPLAFLQEKSRFGLVAVLSLAPGRNMLVAPDGRWLGRYIPAWMRAYPFALLPKPRTGEAILCVDTESGLVGGGSSVGEDFFDRDGNLSSALQQVVDFLGQLEHSRKTTEAAISALAEAGVIQPWPIRLKAEQAERTISGLHRVDEAALNALPDEAFLKLRKGLALPIAYAQMLSVGQLGLFQELARLQARLAPAPAAAVPESLDSLFGISTGDTINFDEFIGSHRPSTDIDK